MGRYLDKLEDCKKEWNAHYNEIGAVAAFGDEKLCRLQFRIEQLSKELDENDECSECEGWGSIECCECNHERDCEECDAGLIPKENDDNN